MKYLRLTISTYGKYSEVLVEYLRNPYILFRVYGAVSSHYRGLRSLLFLNGGRKYSRGMI